MQREQKAAAVEEIGTQLDAANAVFAVDYRGISVGQAAELRTSLRESQASFSVVKNRLAKRATEAAGAGVLDEHLVGPTALTYVRGDAVLAAKTIADFVRKNGVPTYKGGLMDGAALDPDQFMRIARLPGVDVLRGQLVGLAASPLTGVVRTLNALIGGLASQLGQVADQGLVGGSAEAPAATSESAEDPVAGEPAGDDEPAVDAEPQTPAEDEPAAEDDESTSSETETDETPAGDDAGSGDDKED
ncbi:MAG: 50S ribosomal protein L10 [Solirubrobacterales bacterium]|nr:50S ribosomal protein L10 [Solirubrobacterales bacterium]